MAFMSDKDKVFFTGLIDQLCTDYAFHRDVARHIAMKAWIISTVTVMMMF